MTRIPPEVTVHQIVNMSPVIQRGTRKVTGKRRLTFGAHVYASRFNAVTHDERSSSPVQLSKFLGRDKDEGARRSAVSGKKILLKLDKSKEDKEAESKRNELLKFLNAKANAREITNNGEDSDQDVEDFSDPDVDEVPDDIDDEGPEKVEDVHGHSFSNPSRGIILRNELGGDMLNVDPNAAHASEFPEYADIVPAHRLTINSQFEELFVGQQFENKADCVFAIKQYSMKLSIDYKGLVAAIRQSEVPWRSVYCIRHIAVNFHNQYKNKDWRKRIMNMGMDQHGKCNRLCSRCCQIGHYVGESKVYYKHQEDRQLHQTWPEAGWSTCYYQTYQMISVVALGEINSNRLCLGDMNLNCLCLGDMNLNCLCLGDMNLNRLCLGDMNFNRKCPSDMNCSATHHKKRQPIGPMCSKVGPPSWAPPYVDPLAPP
ncbi:hypothetical protein GOBAR_DD05578 [Gossypium barbadense]|nr:hypothetical protein GOBAR_DD05578 [Gossypium barbadense]